jgi:hypothetical protein
MNDFKPATNGLYRTAVQKDVQYYARSAKSVEWQSVDSMMSPTPLGGSKSAKTQPIEANVAAKFIFCR